MPDAHILSAPSVCAVLVLYRKALQDCVAWQTLLAARQALDRAHFRFEVIVYDNSPDPGPAPELPEFAQLVRDPANRGIAHAYNFALSRAVAGDYGWLLTLDQDTVLPKDFLARMVDHARKCGEDPAIGTVVPQLSEGNILLSPRRVRFARTSPVPRGYVGVPPGELHAFNAAALWRVQAILLIGGFSEYFWLDHLDIWMHRQLHRAGFRAFVAGDVQLQHSLSLLDYKTRVTTARYANFLEAESAFTDLSKPWLERAALTCRLAFRFLRQRQRKESPEIRKLTMDFVRYRLRTRRAPRIARWRRRILNIPGAHACARQAVSVCMAAYNGEPYIREQIQSILDQLCDGDELIIVDDASSDRTRDCILGFGNKQIRLIEHSENLGVLRSFEDAIRQARNAIIFLSDQDDIWRSDKVATIAEAFARHPDVTLIASGVRLIDSSGRPLNEPSGVRGRSFRAGFWANLLANHYQGCTMAFRAELRPEILPLPHGYDVLHDIWIGTRNSLSCGRVLFLDEPLVLYRRHASTSTGRQKLTFWRRFRVRFHLLCALFAYSRRRSSVAH